MCRASCATLVPSNTPQTASSHSTTYRTHPGTKTGRINPYLCIFEQLQLNLLDELRHKNDVHDVVHDISSLFVPRTHMRPAAVFQVFVPKSGQIRLQQRGADNGRVRRPLYTSDKACISYELHAHATSNNTHTLLYVTIQTTKT